MLIQNQKVGTVYVEVDLEDLPLLRGRNWIVKTRKRVNGTWSVAAIRSHRYVNGACAATYLHRLILGVTDPKVVVDHIDGNPANNRRSNLRVCNTRENIRNMGARVGKRFRGVSFRQHRDTWRAFIKVDRNYRHLGSFKTEEEAARAYDVAAKEAFGKYARLNFKE